MKKLLIAAAIAIAPAAVLAAPTAHADTVCGNSPKVVALGATSCPFALAVANKMMSGAGTTFSVYSQVTGETYTMRCMIETHGSTTCRDVNGGTAAVQIF